MNQDRGGRWGAAAGYLVLLLGIAAVAFERGAPPANAPLAEMTAFVSAYSAELRAQSLLFVLSASLYLWFFASLRHFLLRAGGRQAADVVFGAGAAWAALQMVFQSVQVAQAMSVGSAEPALVGMLGDLAYALSVIAYAPMGVMLGAVAVASLRTGAFPAWFGWLSTLSAALNLSLMLGLVFDTGPLVPGGALTYVVYLISVVWLLAATTIMVMRLGRPAAAPGHATPSSAG